MRSSATTVRTSTRTPETARTGGEHWLPTDGGSVNDTADGHRLLSIDDMASYGGLPRSTSPRWATLRRDSGPDKPDYDRSTLPTWHSSANAAPVIKLTTVMLVDSLRRGASDIHIEPYEKEFRVRFGIDGVLYNVMALPMRLKDPLIFRIKFMAKLTSGEKRSLQGGRFSIRLKLEDRTRARLQRRYCPRYGARAS